MGGRVSGFSLFELIISVGVLGLIATPIGRLTFEHVRLSVESEQEVVAAGLARAEQERLVPIAFASLANWCSAPPSELPPSESWCVTAGPNPYAGLGYEVTRKVDLQTPTNGPTSGAMKRVAVRVFRSGAVSPAAAVVTYVADGVRFSPP